MTAGTFPPDVVERVARALHAASQRRHNPSQTACKAWAGLTDKGRLAWRARAVDAISALSPAAQAVIMGEAVERQAKRLDVFGHTDAAATLRALAAERDAAVASLATQDTVLRAAEAEVQAVVIERDAARAEVQRMREAACAMDEALTALWPRGPAKPGEFDDLGAVDSAWHDIRAALAGKGDSA